MLTDSEIRSLLEQSEGQFLERKEAMPNRAEIRKTLVAFANTVPEGQYAVLFIGVDDTGNKVGVQDSDSVQKKISEIAKDDCYPPVKCTPTVVKVSGVEIVAVVVGVSRQRPHFTGHAYLRRGSETLKASAELFEELVTSRIDKVRRILQEKERIVTVQMLPRKNLADRGAPMSIAYRNFWPRTLDCRVEKCDAFVLHFMDVDSGQLHTSPISKVTIDFDGIKNRTKFIIGDP